MSQPRIVVLWGESTVEGTSVAQLKQFVDSLATKVESGELPDTAVHICTDPSHPPVS